MRINGKIINTAVKVLRGDVCAAESKTVSVPLITAPVRDVLIKEAPILRKPLSQKEIVNMKPSEFKALLESRTDIPDDLRTLQQYQRVTRIHSPEQLSLYDEINNALLQKNVDFEQRKAFLYNIMSYSPENAQYSKKLLPRLIDKGYDLELISGINITEHNYKYIETVLNKRSMWKAKIDTLLKNKLKSDLESFEQRNFRKPNDSESAKITANVLSKAKEYENDLIKRICRYTNKDNVKYLDQWSKYIDTIPFDERIYGIGQINPRFLDYWGKDTLKILEEFSTINEFKNHYELLEVISRRGHDYNSVKKMFGNKKITGRNYRLLEFKNLEKFRDISLENFNTLTVAEKKEFINAYISAISIKNARHNNYDGIEVLQSNIKMFKQLDTSSSENFMKTYSDVLKKMIDSLAPEDRQIIFEKANWGKYSKSYRSQNPIPALVDDLEKLPYTTEVINGKKIKVSEITSDTNLAISGHCTSGDAFLNIEALEFTDPNEILCVGTKGFGRKVHYSKCEYSLAVRPRMGEDFWMQASHDIDSGNNATKNITNVSKMFSGNNTYYSYVPELIKKELNLSSKEYTSRMSKIKHCTTLDEIGKIDKEMEIAIRNVLKNNQMYEGILRPVPMGVMIPYERPIETINQNVLDYADRRGIRLIRVKNVTANADEIRRQEAAKEVSKSLKHFTI